MKVTWVRYLSAFMLGAAFTFLMLASVFLFGGYYWGHTHPSNEARFNASLDKLDAATHRYDALLTQITACIRDAKTPVAFDRCLQRLEITA